jgi:glyoxylase-like metal-dependent hydrolase (beta-lactamase superfamily II)
MRCDRDWLLALLAALLLGPATMPLLSNCHAAAPMVKTQAPGYYRFMLGEFEVTALYDGGLLLAVDKLMTDISPSEIKSALANASVASPLETSINAYLINTGSKLILIDAGTGGEFGPGAGILVDNLKASGYKPEQVDEIYITHMHGDHLGGVTKDGQAVFPNATLRVGRGDADLWLDAKKMAAAPADAQDDFKQAMETVAPYQSANHFKPIDKDGPLVPGVFAISTPGHTPGHTSYLVESRGQKLYVIGDLIHVGAVQFPYPSATILFDSDAKSAALQRKRIFAKVASEHALVAAAHLSFPGVGHIVSQGAGYSYLPANYASGRVLGDPLTQ